jgi:hypothetical protein
MRSIKVSGWFLVAAVAAVAVFVWAESFTDVNSAQYWGKTGLPALTQAIDANFAMIEDGLSGEPVSATTLAASGATTLSGSVTVIGGGVTTRWDNAASLIDGEVIANDTIDDDSIDFADVTGADLTLTDCGAIAASGDVDANATGGSASDPDFGVAGYARFAGTINETNITRVVNGVSCVTTNQKFLSATGVTNTLVIVDGIITAVN